MSTFNETGLCPEILRAIDELGFVSPTPIQAKMIPNILNSREDVVALAQTGTGKTAAFGLPLVQLTNADSSGVQTLVLCPTRELCLQITSDLDTFSKFLPRIKVVPVYGGASIDQQIRALKGGAQIVVGTPGRVHDLIRRKKLDISSIQWLVLDEADEMLSMGFKDELDAILSNTPEERQTLLFSATMSKEMATQYTHAPVEISVGKRNAGAENISHEYYVVHAKDRYQALKRIADIHPNIYGIVFCRTRQETKDIAEKLMADGYNADALHGDLSQPQRDQVMNRFRIKNLQILVATDVAARGLDVNDLSHIINYNLPDDTEVYTHRSGRTGRAGKSGTSISIIHMREIHRIRDIERSSGKKFIRKMVPDGKEICEKQLFHLVDRVENIEVDHSQIDEYLPVIYKKLSWLDREELIKHFVSVEFNRFLAYYKDAPDLNAPVHEKPERKRNRNRTAFSRFYINVGSKNKLSAARLIGLINEQTGNNTMEIGKIEIENKFAMFEAESRFETDVLQSFHQVEFEGVPVLVEIAKPRSPRKEKDNDGFFKRKTGRKRNGKRRIR